MNFLHIIPADAGITMEFLKGMEELRDPHEHMFLILKSRNWVIRHVPELLAFPQLQYLEAGGRLAKLKKMLAFAKYTKQADWIIWHGLSGENLKGIGLLCSLPGRCKKSVWIERDGDVNSWMRHTSKWKNIVQNMWNRRVRRRIPVMGLTFAGNEGYVRQLEWGEKEYFETPYPISRQMGELLQGWSHRCQPKRIVTKDAFRQEGIAELRAQLPNIQIGLSSQRWNQHRYAMECWTCHSDYAQNILLPELLCVEKVKTSEGTVGYWKGVMDQATRIWGEEITPVRQVGDSKLYTRYLEIIDVAILGSQMATSVTYLIYLLAAGVKVYLPENSPIYQYLLEKGVPVYPLEQCQEGNFEGDIAPLSQEEYARMREFIWEYVDRQKTMEKWKRLYSWLSSEK